MVGRERDREGGAGDHLGFIKAPGLEIAYTTCAHIPLALWLQPSCKGNTANPTDISAHQGISTMVS